MKKVILDSIEINDFLDYQDKDADGIIIGILENLQKTDEIGYAGYDEKKWIKMSLERFIPNYKGENSINYVNEEDRKKARNICIETLKKQRELFDKIHVFLFPTFDEFVKKKMGGVTGFCSGYNVILIFINFEGDWEKNVKGVVLHELTHAISPYYKGGDFSIGEGMILDGLAEHFREGIMKNGKSPLCTVLNKEESDKIFEELKDKLDSKDLDLYQEVFYGTGKYPTWTGYAIGYNLITKFLEGKEEIDWKELLKRS